MEHRDTLTPQHTVVHVSADLVGRVPGFLQGWAEDVARARVLLDAGDLHQAAEVAGEIAQAAGLYGFRVLASLGEQLQAAAVSGAAADASRYRRQIESFLDRVQIEASP